jgi:hypothetical protein
VPGYIPLGSSVYSVKYPNPDCNILLFSLHTIKKAGYLLLLSHSLGPEKPAQGTSSTIPTLKPWASTAALFLLVLIEFLRFKECKNKRGKRLLYNMSPLLKRSSQDTSARVTQRYKRFLEKPRGFLRFLQRDCRPII